MKDDLRKEGPLPRLRAILDICIFVILLASSGYCKERFKGKLEPLLACVQEIEKLDKTSRGEMKRILTELRTLKSDIEKYQKQLDQCRSRSKTPVVDSPGRPAHP